MSQAQQAPDPDDQQARQAVASGLQNAASRQEQADMIQSNMLDYLTDTDLSEGSKDLLRNYCSKAFILGNLEKEEVHELKWELRIDKEMYLAIHPHQESVAQGQVRALINDDPDDRLSALSKEQIMQVETFFKGIWMNITRAKGMKQQEIIKTSINRSEVDKVGEDSGSGLLSKIRGE